MHLRSPLQRLVLLRECAALLGHILCLARVVRVHQERAFKHLRHAIRLPVVLDLYMEGQLPLDRLVTRTFPLKEINEAFAAMNSGEVARAVITP